MALTEDKPKILTPATIGGLQISKPTLEEFYNFLIYGDSGVGKTRLSGSASLVESMSPVLIIDAEEGSSSVKLYPDVSIVKVKNYGELEKVVKELGLIPSEEFPFKTVVLDSATEAQQTGMEVVLKRTVARAKDEDKYKDPDQPEWGDWGKNGIQIKRLMRNFRRLPCHTIVTALADVDKSRPSKPKAKPFVYGQKLSNQLPGFFDIVLFLDVEEKEERNKETKKVTVTTRRYIRTGATSEIIAKDRSEKLPEVINDPTMEKIKELLDE